MFPVPLKKRQMLWCHPAQSQPLTQMQQHTMISGKNRSNNYSAGRVEGYQAAIEECVEVRDKGKAVKDIQSLLVALAFSPRLRVAGPQYVG